MFKIQVSDSVIDHCKKQVASYNFGQRHTANGNPEQQLTGIIGQSVVMDFFGLGNVNGEDGFDNGVDILFNNKKIDVKTMGRTTDVRPNYTNNFLKLQDYFETQVYIFCSFNKTNKELTVCGWIEKEAFVRKRKYFPKGTIRTRADGSSFNTFADLYEIDIIDIHDVKNIEDLKNQLNALS